MFFLRLSDVFHWYPHSSRIILVLEFKEVHDIIDYFFLSIAILQDVINMTLLCLLICIWRKVAAISKLNILVCNITPFGLRQYKILVKALVGVSGRGSAWNDLLSYIIALYAIMLGTWVVLLWGEVLHSILLLVIQQFVCSSVSRVTLIGYSEADHFVFRVSGRRIILALVELVLSVATAGHNSGHSLLSIVWVESLCAIVETFRPLFWISHLLCLSVYSAVWLWTSTILVAVLV